MTTYPYVYTLQIQVNDTWVDTDSYATFNSARDALARFQNDQFPARLTYYGGPMPEPDFIDAPVFRAKHIYGPKHLPQRFS